MRKLATLLLPAVVVSTPVWFPISDAWHNQMQPAVAFDGENFLVTWADARDLGIDTSSNVYACRVDGLGNVLDTAGFLIASGRREQLMPRVQRGPADCLLIWQEGC